MELRSSFCHRLKERNPNHSCSRVELADLQLVSATSDGPFVRSLYLKQLLSLGARSWLHEAESRDVVLAPGHENVVDVTFYVFTTDAGPDQRGSWSLVLADLAARPSTVAFKQWCLRHQAAIISKNQLAAFGRYWGSLAKCVHVWRATHMATKFYKSWLANFGPERAGYCAKTLPPRPLKGRWGRASECEAHFLRCTFAETAVIYAECCDRPRKQRPKKKASAKKRVDPKDIFDDDVADDYAAYTERMNCWEAGRCLRAGPF